MQDWIFLRKYLLHSQNVYVSLSPYFHQRGLKPFTRFGYRKGYRIRDRDEIIEIGIDTLSFNKMRSYHTNFYVI